MILKKRRFVCPNCGWEGHAPVRGAGPLLWAVLVAMVWNAWLFHQAGMEAQALAACLVSLIGSWGATKLPRWIICPACRWKHPVQEGDPQ
ncbi:MAG: hypothetical protein H6686_04795 [Fibrobacteria bacterium]|nr:hypothetical protein [Fibrobacteria bacterium]